MHVNHCDPQCECTWGVNVDVSMSMSISVSVLVLLNVSVSMCIMFHLRVFPGKLLGAFQSSTEGCFSW